MVIFPYHILDINPPEILNWQTFSITLWALLCFLDAILWRSLFQFWCPAHTFLQWQLLIIVMSYQRNLSWSHSHEDLCRSSSKGFIISPLPLRSFIYLGWVCVVWWSSSFYRYQLKNRRTRRTSEAARRKYSNNVNSSNTYMWWRDFKTPRKFLF